MPAPLLRIYNPIVSRASALYRLQQVDLAIDRARGRLKAVEAELAEDRAVQQARGAYEEAERTRKEAAASALRAEAVVEAQRLKIEETDRKLYGGTIHNPKELQELQEDVESLRRHLASLEDQLLEGMGQQEEAEKRADSRLAALELAEADRTGRSAALIDERDRLTAEIERSLIEREAAAAGVNEADVRLYARLRESLGGRAVAELLESSCSACGLTLGSSADQEARSGAQLVRCKQCGRILYAG